MVTNPPFSLWREYISLLIKYNKLIKKWNCSISKYVEMIGFQAKPVDGFNVLNKNGSIPHGLRRSPSRKPKGNSESGECTRYIKKEAYLPLSIKDLISNQANYKNISNGQFITTFITRDYDHLVSNNTPIQLLTVPISNDVLDMIREGVSRDGVSLGKYIENAVISYEKKSNRRRGVKKNSSKSVSAASSEEIKKGKNGAYTKEDDGQLSFGLM